LLKRALVGLIILVALPYGWAPVYDFPQPAPFSGDQLTNPYDHLTPTWQRANFHAHGIAWGGLTSGRQPSEAVADTYRRMGYSVPGVSNYHQIAAFDGVPTLPLYEHGYNVVKRHRLAIGAHRVDWFDLPLWQSLSHQQYIISRVAATADLVALAHPRTRGGYSDDDLGQLTGYQLLEVVNGVHRSEIPWDAALSAGHAVWALANDDTHDLNDPERTAVAWNMINAPTASTDDIVGALRAGRGYAVMSLRNDRPIDTTLSGVEVTSGTVRVTVSGQPSTISFVGQNGALRKTVKNVVNASYMFQDDDTYIRAVVESPQTIMFLNPVMRGNGTAAPPAAASVNLFATWLQRVVFFSALALFLLQRQRARRERVAIQEAPAVIRGARRRTA
jgi:hypothetical protein